MFYKTRDNKIKKKKKWTKQEQNKTDKNGPRH